MSSTGNAYSASLILHILKVYWSCHAPHAPQTESGSSRDGMTSTSPLPPRRWSSTRSSTPLTPRSCWRRQRRFSIGTSSATKTGSPSSGCLGVLSGLPTGGWTWLGQPSRAGSESQLSSARSVLGSARSDFRCVCLSVLDVRICRCMMSACPRQFARTSRLWERGGPRGPDPSPKCRRGDASRLLPTAWRLRTE